MHAPFHPDVDESSFVTELAPRHLMSDDGSRHSFASDGGGSDSGSWSSDSSADFERGGAVSHAVPAQSGGGGGMRGGLKAAPAPRMRGAEAGGALFPQARAPPPGGAPGPRKRPHCDQRGQGHGEGEVCTVSTNQSERAMLEAKLKRRRISPKKALKRAHSISGRGGRKSSSKKSGKAKSKPKSAKAKKGKKAGKKKGKSKAKKGSKKSSSKKGKKQQPRKRK